MQKKQKSRESRFSIPSCDVYDSDWIRRYEKCFAKIQTNRIRIAKVLYATKAFLSVVFNYFSMNNKVILEKVSDLTCTVTLTR